MFKSKVGAVVAVSVVSLAAVAAVPAMAGAASAPAGSKITATASDSTPATGQTFTVSGKFTVGGAAAADHLVKVQRQVNGSWAPVTGAKVDTASNGTYKVRVILNTAGKRELRVVGVGQGSQASARQVLTVTVH